jgi:superfamily II DNA or RNA helicase
LRAWQQAALDAILERPSGDFLASATPAAGKTTFGLRVAHELLRRGLVARVCVVAPTTHICRQWAADAARYGIDLEPNRPNAEGPEPADRQGAVVTYQTVSAGPAVHAAATARRNTLLIADEPHHMGELGAWGENATRAFAQARFRLLLSGTPFRSDNTAIPWVNYDDEGVSASDHAYPTRTLSSTGSAARSRSSPTGARWSGSPTAAPARPTSTSSSPASSRRAGSVRRSTRTATGSARSCATPTPD